MTAPALIRESDARRLAKVAVEYGLRLRIDRVTGDYILEPVDRKKPEPEFAGEIKL